MAYPMINNDELPMKDCTALIELNKHLNQGALALRRAWEVAKHNGMEKTAKELADTVLDIEAAAQSALRNIADG